MGMGKQITTVNGKPLNTIESTYPTGQKQVPQGLATGDAIAGLAGNVSAAPGTTGGVNAATGATVIANPGSGMGASTSPMDPNEIIIT